MNINDVARLAGVTTRAVRHYHRVGALPEPARRANGYRDYTTSDLARLLRVRRMVTAGVPLRRIAELDWSAPVEVAAEFADVVVDLRRRRDEVEQRIVALEALMTTSDPHDGALAALNRLDAQANGALASVMDREREALSLLAAAGADTATMKVLERLYDDVAADPATQAALTETLQATAALTPDSPDSDVQAVATRLASLIPDAVVEIAGGVDLDDPDALAWADALAESPVQREVLRRTLTLLQQRQDG